MTNSIFPLTGISSTNNNVRIIYLDINTDYSINTNQLLLENINAINNQLLNLILTSPGERPFEPEFGSELPGLLFELPTELNGWIMTNKLFTAVNKWLPQIQLDFRRTTFTPLANATGWFMHLEYAIKNLANTNVAADFYFEV